MAGLIALSNIASAVDLSEEISGTAGANMVYFSSTVSGDDCQTKMQAVFDGLTQANKVIVVKQKCSVIKATPKNYWSGFISFY